MRKMYRTDRNNNPTAFTTALAAQAGLREGVDYEIGDRFRVGGKTYYTAKLLGDPIVLTERVIDAVGFYTHHGQQRWAYIGIPLFVWESLPKSLRKKTIHWMYHHEGGTELEPLFSSSEMGGQCWPKRLRIGSGG